MVYWIYKDARDEWRWYLKSVDGDKIADSSKGYKDKYDCEHDVKLVKGSTMKDKDLAGQFCRTPNGQRVFVESVDVDGGSAGSASFHYIEGPDLGKGGTCLVSTLKPLGKEIPVLESMETESVTGVG